MVKLTRIYTGGGDKGETSLSDGSRVAKHDLRVETYGTVDEANAVIGLARAEIARSGEGADMDPLLGRIQNDLFDMGADLCTPEGARPGVEPLRISAAQVARLEQEIDAANAALAPLNSFVLPGGTMLAAHLAPGPDGRAPGRAPDHPACRAGHDQRRGGDLPQPSVGSDVRVGARRQ